MQLEQQSPTPHWQGSVPNAVDGILVVFILVAAALAASMNVPYGGPVVAGSAFVVLAIGGIGGHLLGVRRLRRLTEALIEHWTDRGGDVTGIARSSGYRAEWVIQTSEGEITIGGLAMVPMSRLSIQYDGTGETLAATDVEERLESVAEEWYLEVFGL